MYVFCPCDLSTSLPASELLVFDTLGARLWCAALLNLRPGSIQLLKGEITYGLLILGGGPLGSKLDDVYVTEGTSRSLS